MKKISFLIIIACVGLAGCAGAGISVASWPTDINSSNFQTRCEHVDLRDQSAMDSIFPKYDGWKLVYISEYTTNHKIGTDAAVCFERVKP